MHFQSILLELPKLVIPRLSRSKNSVSSCSVVVATFSAGSSPEHDIFFGIFELFVFFSLEEF